MTEVEPVVTDFAATGRTGRRNAMPDILGSTAGPGAADLPNKLAELSVGACRSYHYAHHSIPTPAQQEHARVRSYNSRRPDNERILFSLWQPVVPQPSASKQTMVVRKGRGHPLVTQPRTRVRTRQREHNFAPSSRELNSSEEPGHQRQNHGLPVGSTAAQLLSHTGLEKQAQNYICKMDAFFGLWETVGSENFEAYLRAIGFEHEMLRTANVVTPTVSIYQDGEKVGIQVKSAMGVHTISFVLGEEFEENVDIRRCKTVVDLKEGKLVQVQKWDDKTSILTREVQDGKMILVRMSSVTSDLKTY
ncbi:hypothetical protein NFI96_014567, partial [Prochilodus magdalenae]